MKKAFWQRLGAAMLSVATVITMLPSMAFATDESGDAGGLTPAAPNVAEGRVDFAAPSQGGILEVKDASGGVYKAYTDEEGISYVQGPQDDAYVETEAKEGVLFTVTKESGSILEITMCSDDGYKVEAYRISIDGGAEKETAASAEQESEFKFNLTLDAEHAQKVTAVFTAKETKEDIDSSAKEDSKENGKKKTEEEAKKDSASDQTKDASKKDSSDTSEDVSDENLLPITPAEIETTEAYIEEATDSAEEDLVPVDYIEVAATSVSSKLFPATIDNLWADRDEDGNWDNWEYFQGQTNSKVYLYDNDPASTYYVGKVDNFGVEGAKLADWCAVKNDTSGTVYDDVIFDEETGLVYVPKKYLKTDESGNAIYASVRIQLLYQMPKSGDESKTQIQVTIHKGQAKGEIAESGLIEAGFYDGKTSFQLAKDKEALASIEELEIAGVKINGVIADEDDGSWSYDEENGIFTLNMIASSISSVEIVIGWDNPELASFDVMDESSIMVSSQHGNDFNPQGYPIKWTASQLAYIDGWTFSSNPSVGDCFELKADNVFHPGGYDWGIYSALPGWYQDWHKYFANQMPSDWLSNDTSGIDVPATLAYSLYTNSGIDLSDDFYTYNATEGNNYQRVIGIGSQTVTVLQGTKKLTTSGDYETVNLFCSHANIPDSTTYGKDAVWMRVLTTSNIKTNADGSTSGFSVVGFVSTVTSAQAGSGLIGLYWKTPAQNGNLTLKKSSSNTAISSNNCNYSLEGAVYAVYNSSNTKVGELKTKADGTSNTLTGLAAGKYTVKETTAPKGYKLDSSSHSVTVEANKTATVSVTDEPGNDPGSLILKKISAGESKNTGLEGAVFKVTFSDDGKNIKKTWYFKTASDGLLKLGSFSSISWNGNQSSTISKNSAGVNLFSIGYYTIQEVEAPKGYVLDNTIYTGKVIEDSSIKYGAKFSWDNGTSVLSVGNEATISNTVSRGDIEFTKTDESGKPMANVAFALTNERTGETHVVVTDSNGSVSTKTLKNSNNTNGNDKAQNNKVASDDLDSSAGVWFGDLSSLNDNAGALTYGKYTLTELTNSSTSGKDPKELTFEITKNGDLISLGNTGVIKNNDIIMGTSLISDATGSKIIPAGEKTTLKDTVSYKGLTVGRSYTMKGKLVDKNTQKVLATAEQAFTPSSSDGSMTMTFSFDTSNLQNVTTVAFENLYWQNALLVTHEDLNDEDQTAYVPGIKTAAADGETADHVGTVLEKNTLTDTVSYENLAAGETYRFAGTLMDADTGEALLDADGKEIASEKTVTLDSASGDVSLDFDVNASELAGHTVVVFEKVYQETKEGEVKVASHEDLTDEGQSIHFPEVGTKASDSRTEDHVGTSSGDATFVDTVTVDNLVPGSEYTVKGVLMDKEAGEELIGSDGKNFTAETTFTASATKEDIELKFNINEDILAGKTIVAFESLEHKGIEVAYHKDIEDEDQTVHYPDLHTTAIDKKTDSHIGYAESGDATTTIVDTVSYKNLIPGKEYTIKGTLVNKDTGDAITNESGDAVKAETAFTPEEADGEQQLEFNFKSFGYYGQSVVVFEDLYHNDIKVKAHADIEDEDQTVRFPEIKTNAVDKDSEGHTGLVRKDTTVVDTVTYTNLIPGKTYTMSGTLMVKETGKELTDKDGNPVTSSVTFTPEERNGSVDIEFTFDSTLISGKTVVAFEKLSYEKYTVAFHEDLTDEDQSVHYPELHTKAIDDQTKDEVAASTKTKIKDTVSYTNLIPGQEYTVTGTLMNKENGKAFILDAKEVTASKTFTCEKANGEVEIIFNIDATELAGNTGVVFEEITANGKIIGEHKDLNDEDQTVFFQKIKTSAKINGGKSADKSSPMTVVDTVSYENLVVGKEYTVTGILMDKSSGQAFTVNGQQVTAEAKFTAEKTSGTVDVTFTFDGSALSKKSQLVVFETLKHKDVTVAEHKDLNDTAQTVTITVPNTSSGNVKTGDNNFLLFLLIVFGTCLIGIASILYSRRRKETLK